MRVSQFEIYRLVQRSLEALGAGFGVDRDGARATAWLEARGLPGLAAFADDLAALEQGIPKATLAAQSPAEIRIDAGGGSAIAFAGAALDLLAPKAGAGSARLLCHCRSPLFLIPPAIEIARGRFVDLGWRSAGGAVQAQLGPDGAVSLFQTVPRPLAEALLDHPVGDVVVQISPVPIPVAFGMSRTLDSGILTRNLDHALNEGIEVDESIWRRLDAVAARVQVPASVVSRERGAGGGDANI